MEKSPWTSITPHTTSAENNTPKFPLDITAIVYVQPIPSPSLTKLGLQHLHRINIPTRLLNRPQRRQTQLPLLLIRLLLPPRLGLGAPARRHPRQDPIAVMRREIDKVVEAGSRSFRRLDVAQ